jgi:hypothetical protein
MDGFPAIKKVYHIISDWHFFWIKKNSKGDGQSWDPWQYGVPSN